MNSTTILRHRNVFYFSGFDPRGPAYYLRLFRKESRKAGFVTEDFQRIDRAALERFFLRWEANCAKVSDSAPSAAAERIIVSHFFMKWDDIIKSHWKCFSWTSLIEYFLVYASGIKKIPLGQIWRVNNGVFWAGLMPGLFASLTLLLSVVAGVLAHGLSRVVLGRYYAELSAVPIFFAALVGSLTLVKVARFAQIIGAHWLTQIFQFNLAFGSAPLPDIEQRQREWAEAILLQQQAQPSKETIFIGHSVGSIVMLEVVRLLATDPRWTSLCGSRPIRMLTLGHCLPFISLNPKAEHFRETLDDLYKNQNVAWWDVTAKIDPLCFYQTLPTVTTSSSSLTAEIQRKPVLLAARFFRMYGRERWRRLRRNKLQVHFLYLMCPDVESGFNLYRAIQGPQNFDQYMNSLCHA